MGQDLLLKVVKGLQRLVGVVVQSTDAVALA
jgi:hypothetical protein